MATARNCHAGTVLVIYRWLLGPLLKLDSREGEPMDDTRLLG